MKRKILLKFSLIGGLLGFFILSPLTMLLADRIHRFMSYEQILAMEENWLISVTEVFKPKFWPWTFTFTLLGLSIGTVCGFLGKRLQENTEAMFESEEKFKVFSEMAKDAFIFSDKNGIIIFWNRAAEEIFGFKQEEVLGKPMWESIVPEKYRENKKKGFKLFAQTGTGPVIGKTLELTALKKDGTTFPIELSVSSVQVRGDFYVVGIVRDITKRKEMEAKLAKAKAEITQILESSSEAIILLDWNYNILRVNKTFCQMIGVSRENILGKKCYDVFKCPACKTPKCPMFMIKNKQVVREIEIVKKRADGTEIICLLNAVPFKNHENKTEGIIEYFRDITAYKKLEAQLRQAQKMEAIGQLAGGIAHDFNNILTSILGYTDLLLAQMDPNSPYYNYLKTIERQTKKAAELTSQILAFSRRRILAMETVDLNSLIAETLEILKRTLGENIHLRFIPEPDLLPIKADASAIEQILVNLCVNARDAMPKGGELIIETHNEEVNQDYVKNHPWAKPGKYVVLVVSDTGCGMDEETKQHIFEPFFTTKTGRGGTGLGLATVYGLVKQHKGMIHVYSELNKGTTFKIYFPVNVQEVGKKRQGKKEKEIHLDVQGGTETILLAEDEEELRKLMAEVLTNLGYRVYTAENGEEALQIFKEHQADIDLLILDMVMPKLNGYQVYKKIKEIAKDKECLFISGYSPDQIHKDFVLKSGIELLQKPFSPYVLAAKVREILDKQV